MRLGARVKIVLLGLPASLALTGCGGGGGVASTPAPIVAAPTTPTTTPVPTTPVPTTPVIVTGGANDTVEYRNAAGAQQANAIVAYNAGATGRGVTAAIIDTGIDTANSEFAGRISAASASTASNGTIQDEGGHGTAVTAILGAARNDLGILGIAYDSTLLVVRSDTPGSCAKSDGCKHDDVAIAAGVDLAVANRARVINLSLGGSSPNSTLRAALTRATAAGIVVVISAGNDGNADPDAFALVANSDAVAQGLIVIAGATDATGALASFSNQAGSGAAHYLAALGSRVRSFDQTGTAFLYSGTSFSAPLIAGAVALLAQAFPNLTGAQIVSLLYSSADDLGAAGVDSVYGNGRLDLVKAFAPRGATSLAGSAVPVSLTDNGTVSTPMGDAGSRTGAAAGVILDGYGRAYQLDLGATLHRTGVALRLAPALLGDARSVALSAGGTTLAVSIAPGADGGATIGRLALDRLDASQARATAGMIATRLGATGVAMAFGERGATMVDRLAGRAALPFLVAGDATDTGFDARTGASVAVTHDLGGFALSASAEQGDARLSLSRPGDIGRRDRRGFGYDRMALAAERSFGPLALGVAMSRLRESSTVLGARLAGVFGGGGATTDFFDMTARLDGPARWRLAATLRRGWTHADAGGAAHDGGRLATRAFALDLSREGLLTTRDRFALRVAEPLRVIHGGYALTLPAAYDYDAGVTAVALRRIDLAPEGHERDVEAAWEVAVGPGWLTTNLYWRHDPGNIAALGADVGAAMRYGFSF